MRKCLHLYAVISISFNLFFFVTWIRSVNIFAYKRKTCLSRDLKRDRIIFASYRDFSRDGNFIFAFGFNEYKVDAVLITGAIKTGSRFRNSFENI